MFFDGIYKNFFDKMLNEAEIIKYLNIARENPSYYTSLVEKQYSSFINDT